MGYLYAANCSILLHFSLEMTWNFFYRKTKNKISVNISAVPGRWGSDFSEIPSNKWMHHKDRFRYLAKVVNKCVAHKPKCMACTNKQISLLGTCRIEHSIICHYCWGQGQLYIKHTYKNSHKLHHVIFWVRYISDKPQENKRNEDVSCMFDFVSNWWTWINHSSTFVRKCIHFWEYGHILEMNIMLHRITRNWSWTWKEELD